VTIGSCASCLPLFLATGTKVSTAMTACSATRGPAPPMLALSLVTLRNTVLANSGFTWRLPTLVRRESAVWAARFAAAAICAGSEAPTFAINMLTVLNS
jgi:hypothetical protein